MDNDLFINNNYKFKTLKKAKKRFSLKAFLKKGNIKKLFSVKQVQASVVHILTKKWLQIFFTIGTNSKITPVINFPCYLTKLMNVFLE